MSCDVISYVLSVSLGPQQLVQLFSCVDQVVLYVWTQFTLIPFDVDLSNLTRQAITEIRRFLHGGRPPTSRAHRVRLLYRGDMRSIACFSYFWNFQLDAEYLERKHHP